MKKSNSNKIVISRGMKSISLLFKSLFFLFTICIFHLPANSQQWAGQLHLTPSPKNNSRLDAVERMLAKKNRIFSFDADIQFGLSISETNSNLNTVDTSTQQLENTKAKYGPSIGVILDLSFFGFGLTSGAQFSSKGFKTTSGTTTSLNYINIPVLLYIGFEISKARIDINFGPYFGILLSKDEATYFGLKKLDVGLTGNLSAAYMFNEYVGALIGGKYEYGGLNNLQENTESVSKTTTSTFYIYSGLKFEF